jgi:hypothetical protein
LGFSAPDDLHSSCGCYGFYLFCGSGLLLVRLASAACLHEFAETAFEFEANGAASDTTAPLTPMLPSAPPADSTPVATPPAPNENIAGRPSQPFVNNMAVRQEGDRTVSTTTGDAGTGAKFSNEQRTKIATAIKSQHVQPGTNVNFSISIGARVPRNVRFHPLPAEIVTIYPEWRGYEFFLVNNQIVVVNPRTLEIVDVIDV